MRKKEGERVMNDNNKVNVVLRTLLEEMFDARERGIGGVRFARAHGYADGYMRALMESGMATQEELLAVVLETRAQWSDSRHDAPVMGLKSCKAAV